MDILSDLSYYEASIEKYDKKKGNIFVFFCFRILSILTHTQREMGEDLKTDNNVYPKWPNS